MRDRESFYHGAPDVVTGRRSVRVDKRSALGKGRATRDREHFVHQPWRRESGCSVAVASPILHSSRGIRARSLRSLRAFLRQGTTMVGRPGFLPPTPPISVHPVVAV